jgi:hypothetical protein
MCGMQLDGRRQLCCGAIMDSGRAEKRFLRIRLSSLILVAVSLLSCDDGSERVSGQTGDPGCVDCNTVPVWNGCRASSWPAFEEEITISYCESVSGSWMWSCDCGQGLKGILLADRCSEALETACGISPDDEPNHCTSNDAGTCWPGEGDQSFDCLCYTDGEDEDWRVGMGGSCSSALERACSE